MTTSKFLFSIAAAGALLLTGCGEQDTSTNAPKPAETATVKEPKSPKIADAPAAKKVEVADAQMDEAALLKRGRIVYLRCRSCHHLTDKPRSLTGPNLNGLFGAKAASKEAYKYSDALSNADITWTAETLDKWIENPSKYVPGTRMVFAGLGKERDRKALIAYMADATKE